MNKLLVTIIFLLIFAQTVFAQEITMNEAITFGLLNNPEIKASKAKLNLSDADIKEAGLFSNPKILLDAAFADKSYKGGIIQTVELGGKRKKRVKIAKSNKEIIAQEIAVDIINLRSEIRAAYIELYTARERLKTSRDILMLTEHLINIARKREQAGQISNLEVLQAEIAYITAKNNIQLELLKEIQALNNFNNKLGYAFQDTVILKTPSAEDDFKNIMNNSLENYIEYAEKNNPEIKRLEKCVEKTQNLERLARSSAIPNLSVAVGPNILVTEEEKTTTNLNVFTVLEIEIPVFNHGQAAVMQAKAQRNIFERQIDAEKNKINLAVKNAFAEVTQNKKLIDTYETELLPKAKIVLDKSDLSFKEGKSDILLPLTSQAAYIELIKSYTNTLESYYKSLNNLEKAIGVQDEAI